MEPIKTWLNLIRSNSLHENEIKSLSEIYEVNKPYVAGIIFTGYCPNRCHHCIYPPDFNKYNFDLSVENWKRILEDIYEDLNIKTFVYNGRSLNRKGLEILKYIKESFPDIIIGLIDNGLSVKSFINELSQLSLDWMDISLDGMESDHDIQRNLKGSFKRALDAIIELSEKEVAQKIHILTCLTKINRNSVTNLIKFMNEKGFKNFFISPLSVMKGYRPSEELKILDEDFIAFIEDIFKVSDSLEDSWIEIDLFDIEYFYLIKKYARNLWQGFLENHDHMAWETVSKDNNIFINYYPLSLAGTREFIVNCTGDVILPKVMAKGGISENEVVGSLLMKRASEIVRNLPCSGAFEYYMRAFREEKAYLKGDD